MNNELELFGIPFRICNEQQLYQESCDFLEEPVLYTVVFVTADQCGMISEMKKEIRYKEQQVWVPGDDALRFIFPKKERHDMTDFSVQRYIMRLCEYAADMGLEIGFLMEKGRELALVRDGIRKAYPYLSIHELVREQMTSSEMMINEINSVAPEILILGLHSGELRRFVEQERHKTNARLCICIGDLLTDEMSKKNKLFHTITMSRVLKKRLHKYSKKEQR